MSQMSADEMGLSAPIRVIRGYFFAGGSAGSTFSVIG